MIPKPNGPDHSKITGALLIFAVTIILIALIATAQAEDVCAAGKTGPGNYKGKLYFYNNGKIAKSKYERIMTANGYKYYVLKDGRIYKGWNTKGKHLYYFSRETGRMQRARRINGITLLPNGRAQKTVTRNGKKIKSLNAWNRYYCIRILKRRGVYYKSKKKQLRSAWNYMMSIPRGNYAYIYPGEYNKSSEWPKNWPKKLAYIFLTKRKGNCYGWACGFAAFARTIGYDPYVYYGKCRGFRDGMLGLTNSGWTRHSNVKINGRWYDPEYWWKWHQHYNYGSKKLTYSFISRHRRRYRTVPGELRSAIKTVSGNLKLINGRYYYLNKSGKGQKGVYYINKKLYNFNKKTKYGWSMTKSERAKLQKAIKKGKPFSELKKLIGNPKSTEDSCDEYMDKASKAHFYPHKVYVATHLNANGTRVIHKVGKN